MVAAQIVDGLERARELRIEYAAMLAYNEAMGVRAQRNRDGPVRSGGRSADASGAFAGRRADEHRSPTSVAWR